MKALKIGILLNPSREMMDYEARLFSILFNDARYEIVCTIKHGRKPTNKNTNYKIFAKQEIDQSLLMSMVFRVVGIFETQLLKKKGPLPFDKTEVISQISGLPCVEIFPEKKGCSDVFSKKSCAKIEELKLDVLLKHEFQKIEGEILKIPKYGIWSLNHEGDRGDNCRLGGFWEVYYSKSVTEVTLQVLGEVDDSSRTIQKGIYNTENFWYLNFEKSLDNSIVLVLKHLALLFKSRELKTIPSGVDSKTSYGAPSFFQILRYIVRKYSIIAFRKLWKIFNRAVKSDDTKEVWKLHIGKGNIENADLLLLKKIEPPRNEFWADPFLFDYDKKTYVFFENYEYSREKGKISVGIYVEDQIVDVVDCLDVDYHLSYPFLFKHNNQVFMIPETGQMKRLEIWKCDNFPNKWSLEKTCFEGEGRSIVDSTIAKDLNNQYWLFANFGSGRFLDHVSNLSVFKIDSPMMNEIIPHKLNPVITDCRSARNAGNFFVDKNGRLIRPSQANQNGVYGECLNLCHVKELTIDTYVEEILETIKPEFKKGLFAVHHVSHSDNYYVVDGCYKDR